MSVAVLSAEERRAGLGATDIAAVVGVSTYRTPIEVYQEKVGEAPDREPTWRMRMGQILEDAIADAYSEQSGRKLARVGTVRHKHHPFLYAHPDRRVIGEPGLVEIKTAEWRSSWADGPTPYVRVQAQWQMALTDRLWVDIALLSGNNIDIFRVDRDQALIDDLEREAVRFWTEHVIPHVPPPVDASEAYTAYLKARHPKDTGAERTATPEEQLLLDELREAQAAEKAAKAHAALVKNRIREAMGEVTRLVAPDGTATYKWQEGFTYTVEREGGRVLRVQFKGGG